MKYGLSEKQLDELLTIFNTQPEVEEVVLFGSRALGTYKEASDIDFAVKGKKVTDKTISQLQDDFEESNLPFFVDIINYQTIDKPKFKRHIDEKGVQLLPKGMSEWKEKELGKLADIKGGKRLPKGNVLLDFPTSHPYIRTKDIHNNSIKVNDLLFVPEDVFPFISRYIVEEGDVIISIVGTIGLCAVIPRDLHMASLTENCAKIVNINENLLDKKFLYLFLIGNIGQEEINKRNVGSTQPKLPLYNIKDIPIPLPPIPEQKAIAEVLSSLSDKIDLLHRQNKTLEQIAETLFRQWFVEEAKEEWKEGSLGDVLELVYGKGLKKEIRTNVGFPVVGSSGIVDYHSEFLVEAPGIVIGRKGTLGKVIYLWDNFFPIDTTYYIKSKVKSVELLYEYYLLKTLKFKDMNSDSAVPGLNRDIALSTEIKIAPIENIQEFNEFVSDLAKKIRFNNNQIHTLENLRDTLLPKLMSGEVRIANNG